MLMNGDVCGRSVLSRERAEEFQEALPGFCFQRAALQLWLLGPSNCDARTDAIDHEAHASVSARRGAAHVGQRNMNSSPGCN
jgi:hypothetical protein